MPTPKLPSHFCLHPETLASCTKTMKPSSFIALLLLPISLFAIIFLVVYPNDLRLQTLTSSCLLATTALGTTTTNSSSLNFTGLVTPKPDFRMLIGIFTLPDNYERRHLLRMVYKLQTIPPRAHIDIKFVFCNLTKEEHSTLIALEIIHYDDIIILNCRENMNEGKTYTYFSSMPSILDTSNGPPYDYIMKADDDIYFRLPRLAESLYSQPKEDFYYGYVIPCDSMDPFREFMYGAGYAISWDLVEWIATDEIPKVKLVGGEDWAVGQWFIKGNKAKNRFNNKPNMYDFPIPVPINECSHEFIPDTIAVHRVKNLIEWKRTLDYFNVTAGVKPSKLYHFNKYIFRKYGEHIVYEPIN